MEGSNSEAIFESLNLSPQLFINEVLNMVDAVLDEAFQFFLQEASTLMKTEGTSRSAELSKGVTNIRESIQVTLDQCMQIWEEYCLRHCFRVPEEFTLPKANEFYGDDLPDLHDLTDTELDVQLNSLRNRLTLAGKESAELSRKLHALKRQSLPTYQSAGSINEALQLYMKHDATESFQELTTMASEFRAKVQNLKRRRMEETQRDIADMVHARHDVLRMPRGNSLAKLEQLQKFLDETAS
ncbi:hypothetical protein OROHE_007958 [Orobanche hederae]